MPADPQVVVSRAVPTEGLAARHGVGTVELYGLTFLNLDEARFVDLVVAEASAGRGGWVVTPNVDILRLTHQDPEIHALVQSADALVADGMPLIWASQLQGTPLHSRVCGSDLTVSIPAGAAEAGLSVYFLGGAGSTAEETAQILQRQNPSLRVAGTYSPPFGFEKDPAQYDLMTERLLKARPDIVLVALSFPKGERLIQRIRHASPNAWWIGVGAAFDFMSGRIQRAPSWMQRTGTEWIYRLSQDPGRLAERYLLRDMPFAAQLFGRALLVRLLR